MDSDRPLIVPLRGVADCDEAIVGGKANKLAQIEAAGLSVPRGFCITTWAYQFFIDHNAITDVIRMELGRKPMADMRWEEIWDVALRIRSVFLNHACSQALEQEIDSALRELDPSKSLAVRSSSPSEDAPGASFAGLHESIIDIRGRAAVQDAVRLVWASLWSDAALLYRRELGLDPVQSRMAVLVQEMVDADLSGVAFGCDPRTGNKDLVIIESVAGPCRLLVDGLTDPDRWQVDRGSRKVIEWIAGDRDNDSNDGPLLREPDLQSILDALLSVERQFLWAPDMEWCRGAGSLTILQARPVTTGTTDSGDKRTWYLTLRPGDAYLGELRRRVAEELIPRLEAEGRKLAAEEFDSYDDRQLADVIEQRRDIVKKWKKIYWDEFIPFAHGVRRLATYYNDAVQPDDPYEFVGLLRDQPLIAVRRNAAIARLAEALRLDQSLLKATEGFLEAENSDGLDWTAVREHLSRNRNDSVMRFMSEFEELIEQYMDITYGEERLNETLDSLLRNIIQLAQADSNRTAPERSTISSEILEQRLFAAVDVDRHHEARAILEIGRISWKLRDDDNLLIARLESQFLRALEIGVERLAAGGRMKRDGRPGAKDMNAIVHCLRGNVNQVELNTPTMGSVPERRSADASGESRQLVGQPASPGIATGRVRCIRDSSDLGAFRYGEVLVCDAIQPTMTHLVPLAGAIVERRGGMLIHGAIIARELGIPCVNGVKNASDLFANGDVVTVDGYLGIVTVGEPELDLEVDFAAIG